MSLLAITPDARYRSVVEYLIVELVALAGYGFEVAAGARDAARREAARALDRWVGLGLPWLPASRGGRRFDPAEVVNFLKAASLAGRDGFWEERFIATGRRLVASLDPGAGMAGEASSPLPPARFAVTFRRVFDLPGEPAGGAPRLRLPLPLESATLSDLSIVPLPAPDGVTLSRAGDRLEARISAPCRGRLVLGYEARFTARPAAPPSSREPLPPQERALYTRPDEGMMRVGPRIRTLAAELAGDLADPGAALRRFWDFVLDRLTCGVVHYDAPTLSDPIGSVLDSGWFDCQLGSALLVALCRARGIPARLLGGYLLYPVAPTRHFWGEAWLDARGWVPFDLLSSDLSVRGRDLAWRDHFFGRLDYRMTTECLPRSFTGTPWLRLPPLWHMLSRPLAAGAETGLFAADDSTTLLYADRLTVERVDGPSGVPSRVKAGPL